MHERLAALQEELTAFRQTYESLRERADQQHALIQQLMGEWDPLYPR